MARDRSGVKDKNIEITEDALSTLIKSYCRESGVRNLQKHIEKVKYFKIICATSWTFVLFCITSSRTIK